MCSSYKEYSYIKMTEKPQGPSPGVHLRGVSVLKRVYSKMTKKRQRDRHQEVSVSERCPYYKEYSYSKMTEKRQGPTPGVRLVEVFVKRELTVFLISLFQRIFHTLLAPELSLNKKKQFPCFSRD